MEQPSILIAVDLPINIAQLEPVIRLAAAAEWGIDLLHVMGPHVMPSLDTAVESTVGEIERQQMKEAAASIAGSSRSSTASGDTTLSVTAHTIAGPVVEVILQQAEERRPEMIAIIGHKHHLAHRIALGSVEATLLKVAEQPILVLPSLAEPDADAPLIPTDGLGTATDRLIEILERTQTDGEFEDLRTAAMAQRQEPDSEEGRERLGTRMQETLEHFESDHPSVTRAINDVAYYLSGMGL